MALSRRARNWKLHTVDGILEETLAHAGAPAHPCTQRGGRPRPTAQVFRSLQPCGIKYVPEALPFNVVCSAIAMLPWKLFWDWQHNFCSSGGIAQYHVNSFCHALLEAGIIPSLDTLDDFAQTVILPKSQPRLSKEFFQDRVVGNRDGHIRGFATETLIAVELLGMWIDQVLVPKGTLADESKIFLKLRRILDILKSGDAAVGRLDELDTLFYEYHKGVLDLFHCVQKIHYMRHIPESIRYLNCCLSCFAPERKHKEPKSLAAFTYKNCYKSMLAHDIRKMKLSFQDANFFEPVRLNGGGMLTGLERTLGCDGAHGANSVFTPRGTFSQKEILVWKNGQTICAGVAISFLRLSYVNRDSRFKVVAEPLVHLGGDTFASRGVPPVLINLELVRAHVSYQKVQGGLRLNLPRVW